MPRDQAPWDSPSERRHAASSRADRWARLLFILLWVGGIFALERFWPWDATLIFSQIAWLIGFGWAGLRLVENIAVAAGERAARRHAEERRTGPGAPDLKD